MSGSGFGFDRVLLMGVGEFPEGFHGVLQWFM